MKLIIDVSYKDNKAKVVGGIFENWNDKKFSNVFIEFVENVQEYISGEFYKRELPCILSFLERIDTTQIELIIIDGFVFLDDDKRKGLGAYLYENLNKKISVIGVAKTRFYNNTLNVIEIFRCNSKNALYISSIGIDLSNASMLIHDMFGEFRIPHLIKQIDTETKKNG